VSIEVPAGGKTPIVFVAFCADFDLPNPTASDSLYLAKTPEHLVPVANLVVSREVTEDDMNALQVAIWLKQGKTPAQIAETFPFTPADLARARQLINR